MAIRPINMMIRPHFPSFLLQKATFIFPNPFYFANLFYEPTLRQQSIFHTPPSNDCKMKGGVRSLINYGAVDRRLVEILAKGEDVLTVDAFVVDGIHDGADQMDSESADGTLLGGE